MLAGRRDRHAEWRRRCEQMGGAGRAVEIAGRQQLDAVEIGIGRTGTTAALGARSFAGL